MIPARVLAFLPVLALGFWGCGGSSDSGSSLSTSTAPASTTALPEPSPGCTGAMLSMSSGSLPVTTMEAAAQAVLH